MLSWQMLLPTDSFLQLLLLSLYWMFSRSYHLLHFNVVEYLFHCVKICHSDCFNKKLSHQQGRILRAGSAGKKLPTRHRGSRKAAWIVQNEGNKVLMQKIKQQKWLKLSLNTLLETSQNYRPCCYLGDGQQDREVAHTINIIDKV